MHLYIPPGLVECVSASGYSGKDQILGLNVRSGSVLNGISRMIKRNNVWGRLFEDCGVLWDS